MTWLRVLQQKRRCKTLWIKYLVHVTAIISQSASRRLRWYISQRLESLTWSLPKQGKVNALQVVYKFTYLGSTLSRVAHIDDEVNARIAKASAAFGRLCRSIRDRSGIRLDTKLKVYTSVLLPILSYACET